MRSVAGGADPHWRTCLNWDGFSSETYSLLAMPPPIVVQELAQASDLVAALRPHEGRWLPAPSRWIFRGQLNAKFELVPTAFRRESWEPFAEPGEVPFDPKSPASGGMQGVQEYRVLRHYFERLDHVGLDVPNEIFVRQYLDHVEKVLANGGIHDHLHFVIDPAIATFAALAQHHGVPTRLLDWTRHGLHAACFAAREAAALSTRTGNLSVWALSLDFVADTQGVADMGGGTPHLQILTAARSSNPNLHAQAGLFTAWFEIGAVSSLEAKVPILVDALAPRKRANWTHTPPVYHFTLPHSEAPALLRMLSYENIDGSRMFPGRDGVVRAMKERHFWDRRD